MFEDQLDSAEGDRRALADLAAEVEADLRMAGCRKLLIAAAWADAHSEVDHPDGWLLVERLVSMGPAGTPVVAETAPAGLVGPFHTSTRGARGWIGDALTVRHRLPKLWDRVVAGEVYAWQARQIATLTSDLSVATVGQVDEQITPWVTQLSWPGLLNALEASIAHTDQLAYERRERLAAAAREVRATPSEHGLRTLIARGEAGDVAMLMALHARVAECLAEEGDEDPLSVRMSKAMGWIAHPLRCADLLARHAHDPDPHAEPWEQVAAHEADDTDPWADDLPPAGWERAEHGNFYQPGFDDDGWWDTPTADHHDREYVTWPADPPIDDDDLTWWARQHDTGDTGDSDHNETGGSAGADQHDAHGCQCQPDKGGTGSSTADPINSAVNGNDPCSNQPRSSVPCGDDTASVEQDVREPDPDTHANSPAAAESATRHSDTGATPGADDRGPDQPQPDNNCETVGSARPCTCGADTKITERWPQAFRPPGWRPLTPTELSACAPTVNIHVHLTDQTLVDNHGVVRTDAGPILLEQLKRYLVQHDAHIKVYPVIDPAATASADSYEIPLRLRRAMAIRHPRSVFPHSATSSRLDLDHMPPYVKDGPPGQTSMATLGPLARNEHRAVTVGHWDRRQPEPGTYLWRDPQNWIMITTNQGTLCLGHTTWAHQLWETAASTAELTSASAQK